MCNKLNIKEMYTSSDIVVLLNVELEREVEKMAVDSVGSLVEKPSARRVQMKKRSVPVGEIKNLPNGAAFWFGH